MFSRASTQASVRCASRCSDPCNRPGLRREWRKKSAGRRCTRTTERMMESHKVMLAAGAALLLASPTGSAPVSAAPPADGQPTVVELFTSQGCSSCPPANANLAILSDRPGILALSFGVTYWDQLGWKDTFAKPEFTARQVTYEGPLNRDGPFTPQMVVDGRTDTVGNRLADVEGLIAAAGDKRGRPATTIDE